MAFSEDLAQVASDSQSELTSPVAIGEAFPEQSYPTRSLRVISSAAGVTANCFLGFLE